MKRAIVILIILLPIVGLGAIYERKDAQGNATYSDEPTTGSRKVTLQPQTIVPGMTKKQTKTILDKSKTKDKTKKGSSSDVPAAEYYKGITVAYPNNEQTFQNQRDISVGIDVKPPLRSTEKLQLLVDGTPFGKPSSSNIVTWKTNTRGTHQIQAIILNEKGDTVRTSKPVKIFVHLAHVGGK